MSGLIFLTLAGLLMQQPLPHPSTLSAYRAPVIRPFEPGAGFGQVEAEGDTATGLHRRPLAAPVTVEAYTRSYEYTPGDAEIAYEQGVVSAELRADQTAGPLDGMWRVTDPSGQPLFGLALSDAGTGTAEGGWRSETRSGAALFDGLTLTLENAGSAVLERHDTGWRGTLTVEGQARPVRLSRPD